MYTDKNSTLSMTQSIIGRNVSSTKKYKWTRLFHSRYTSWLVSAKFKFYIL